jgi:hypothetical protein
MNSLHFKASILSLVLCVMTAGLGLITAKATAETLPSSKISWASFWDFFKKDDEPVRDSGSRTYRWLARRRPTLPN